MTSYPRESFRSLKRYTPDRRPVDHNLADNTNLWGAQPDAVAVVQAAESGWVSNYPTVYSEELKEAVSEKFGVPTDAVATGCGSDDILDSVFRAACGSGARIAYPIPTFLMIPHFLVVNGIEGVRLGDAYTPPSPSELLATGADVVYACTPNNPTGTPLSRAWIDELIDLAGPAGPVIVIDEAYLEFGEASDGHEPGERPLVERALESRRLLLARTFSKAYGLAGLRVGYGIAHPELIEEVEKARGPFKVGLTAERAAAAALRDESGWLEPTVREVVECRDRLLAELRGRGAEPLPSASNFIMLPVPVPAREAAAGLRERGIAVRPYPEVPGLGEALRMTVGPWPVMTRVLEVWDELAEGWAERVGG